MNILINYPKYGESGPTFSLQLTKGFVENGHTVYAVIGEGVANEKEWYEVLPPQNICAINLHTNAGSSIGRIRAMLRVGICEQRKVRKQFSGIVFDYDICTFYSKWTLFVNRIINKKKIVTICHDPLPHSGARTAIHDMMKYYKHSDEMFVLTDSFRKIASQTYGIPLEKVHYVPHGRMDMYKKNAAFDMLQGLYKKKFHILFFGRIEKYKGLSVLADAYERLFKKYTDVELTILGNGDFTPYAEKYSALENVHIENRYIKDEEVGNYFALKNTIAVVPYIDATQSGVIPIAYEFGTPVVYSNVGGLKEQLDNGNIGVSYDDNSGEKLADALMKIIGDEKAFEVQRNKMFTYRESLNWSNIAKRMLESMK